MASRWLVVSRLGGAWAAGRPPALRSDTLILDTWCRTDSLVFAVSVSASEASVFDFGKGVAPPQHYYCGDATFVLVDCDCDG